MFRREGVRLRRMWVRLSESVLFVPGIYVLLALGLSIGLVRWDRADPITLGIPINSSSAETALSALTSGMLAFTGFVTSVVLLVVQFGTSEFSPRLLRWFRRDRTLQYALSTFIATFLFALVSTEQVGSGPNPVPPSRTLIAALALTLLSIIMFLLLIDRTQNGLRVAAVVQGLDVAARDVFDAVYPTSETDAVAAKEAARGLHRDTPIQTVYNGDVGAVIVTLDQASLIGLAQRGDAVIEMI